MKKVIAMVLCLISIMCTSIYAVTFTDLPETHWAYTNITKLVEEGVINGYPDGTYRPEGTVTRGEYLKLIMTAARGEELFRRIEGSGHWASAYLFFAKELRIVEKDVREEMLDEPITRIEMVEILARVCLEYKKDVYGSGEKRSFSDIEDTFVDHVTSLGLINGYEDGTFRPDNNMTRAEVSAIIYRYMNI